MTDFPFVIVNNVKLADFCLWGFEFEILCGGSTQECAALVQKEEEEEQIDTQEKTKTMKKKKTKTDRLDHGDLSKMEEQIEEEASFCSLLTVPRAGILWRFCENY